MPPRVRHAGGPVARWICCVLALSCALSASCASRVARQAIPPSAGPQEAPVTGEIRIGVVRAIGADQRYVLIETPSALATSALSDGQLLHCRPPAADSHLATADLRVSRERHQSLIVANVVAGEPALGAIVYSAPDTIPASPLPADSISSVSSAPLSGLFGPRKP